MKAKEFDEAFDDGKDISQVLDYSRSRKVNEEPKRVNVDFPIWMVKRLDEEASRVGVTRQSIIKVWIADRLEQVGSTSHEDSRQSAHLKSE